MRRIGVLSLLLVAAAVSAPRPAAAAETKVVAIAPDSAPSVVIAPATALVSINVVALTPTCDLLVRVERLAIPVSIHELQVAPDSMPAIARLIPVNGSALERSAMTQRQSGRTRVHAVPSWSGRPSFFAAAVLDRLRGSGLARS